MKFIKVSEVSDPLEKELYEYMYKASKDGILESKEFEKWCKNNYYKIYNWFTKVIDEQIKICLNDGIISKKRNYTTRFSQGSEKKNRRTTRLKCPYHDK